MSDKNVKVGRPKTDDDKGRRDFIKTTAAAAVGLAMAPILISEVKAQKKLTSGTKATRSAIKLNRGAVLPDGKAYSRQDILRKLGLDPSTPADKWLTILCGSNAAGLKTRDAARLLKKGVISENILTPRQLQQIRRFRGN